MQFHFIRSCRYRRLICRRQEARLFLWGYYAAFPVASMDWERSTQIASYYEVPFPWTGFLVFLAAVVLIYLLCRTITIRKEV